ncbi:MAG: hypothetical protein F6J87_04780 [Spirulina sp. SIO3F2]|nr:hypothetical protein [Spirulina sp. SIO3F2]
MQITLSSQQTQILQTLFQQGGYPSLEIALDAALLSLADQIAPQDMLDTPEYLAWLEQTRLQITEGVHAAEQGEVLDADVMITQLQAKVATAQL